MKKLNSILFLVAGIAAYAQPSITRSAIERINIPITFKAGDVALTATPGPSGANVNWDFSAYAGANTSTSTMNVCPGKPTVSGFPKPTGLPNRHFPIPMTLFLSRIPKPECWERMQVPDLEMLQ